MVTKAQDPTQQSKNRADAKRKLEDIKRQVSRVVDEWMVLAVDKRMDESQLEELLLAVFLLGGSFYLNGNIEQAFRSGVFGADRDAQRVLQQMLASGEINFMFDSSSIFYSADYQQALRDLQQGNQAAVEGHIKQYAAQISTLVLLGLSQDKRPVDDILDDVVGRIDAMFGRIENTTNTAINRGASSGAIFATVLMAQALGQEALVKHKSALLPTTRPHHASRHNRVYTVDEQRAWWASGSNRYNCHCHIEPYFKRSKP